MPLYIIILRLSLAIIISGIIGYDREHKSRPAGIRTHMLVCLGATVVALIQDYICIEVLAQASKQPEFSGVLRSDPARLICQVVSGIGFLGAGTIIVTKRSVSGLTTAASLWSTAAVGLALGMGYYEIAILSSIIIILVLVLFRTVFHMPSFHNLELKLSNYAACQNEISELFKNLNFRVRGSNYSLVHSGNDNTYSANYLLEIPSKAKVEDLISPLSEIAEIISFKIY